ncbi:MAG: carbonic anhydrase [Terriglobia bacterium]
MAIIDEVLKANETYAKNFNHGKLPNAPPKKLAVLACMDARIVLSQILGTAMGDIHMIRNAVGIATEDPLRSLIISH